MTRFCITPAAGHVTRAERTATLTYIRRHVLRERGDLIGGERTMGVADRTPAAAHYVVECLRFYLILDLFYFIFVLKKGI